MEYSTRNKRKRGFRFGWILLFLSLALVAMAGISINKIRNGQPGFMSNLWEKDVNAEPDAFLDGNALTLPIPGYVKTVMLLGSDYQPSIGFRTDVMLLVAMNTKTSEFHLLSFPRDLWVNIPGVGPQRLNTALPFGGNELLSDTLALNFGFRPDNFAMVDFDGFKNIIDVMGGVDVDVEKYMEDECWLNDTGWCVIEPGRQVHDRRRCLLVCTRPQKHLRFRPQPPSSRKLLGNGQQSTTTILIAQFAEVFKAITPQCKRTSKSRICFICRSAFQVL